MYDAWFASPTDFLGKMASAERQAFLSVSQTRRCKRHGFIFEAGSPGENVYLLNHGRVKIFGLSALGKEVILWFCFPGEVFGVAEMPRGGRREVYAEACTDCDFYTMPQATFKNFLITHPATAMAVIELLSCRLRVLGDMLQNLTTDDVATRVVKLLLRLCMRYGKRDQHGICLELPITHQEIADMIGATRQTVTEVIGELKRMGAVRVAHHRIWIQREELLERMVANVPYKAPTMPETLPSRISKPGRN